MIMKIVRFFLEGPFAVMFIVAALLLGGMALVSTPREEDPQIVVPMADVEVAFPGHSPSETEELVTRPLERIFWQLEGVEHVYSASARDGARVTVRFHVGEDRDRAMVRLRDKMDENLNRVPDGVTGWLVIPVSINDVPIVILTLTSPKYDGAQLRRIARNLARALKALPTSRVQRWWAVIPARSVLNRFWKTLPHASLDSVIFSRRSAATTVPRWWANSFRPAKSCS